MKKFFIKALSASFALIFIIICVGCGNEKNNDTSSQIETTSATTPTEAAKEFDIKNLHSYDADSTDPFSGAWHITDGEGKNFDSFVYLFDGSDRATLIIDNMGYLGKYSYQPEKGLFTSQLMFGINGTYTYKFSDDNTKIELTNTEDKTTTNMEKIPNFNCIPTPDDNPKIDENLLGAWMSDNGEYFYFDEDGIMYQNQFNTMFTFSKYSVKDGQISSTYKMEEAITDTYKYSVENDTLTLDNYTYKKIPVDELI